MTRLITSAAVLLISCIGATALAQSTIATWDFNSQSFNASTGSGTMTLIGGTTAVNNTGSPSDPGVPNNAQSIANHPEQGTASGTAGVEFIFSTAGFEDIRFLFDQRHSNTSARHVQVKYSVDGGQEFIDGPIFAADGGDTWHMDRGIDLAGVPGAGNNPGLRIRVVSVFDPELSPPAYSPSRPPPASSYAGSGNHRIDYVRVIGTAVVSVPPQGTGAFSPTAVCRGNQATLTVTASSGQNPLSNQLAVRADLSALGGSAFQALDFQGGNTYSTTLTIAQSAGTGFLTIPVTISDDLARSSVAPVPVAVGDCTVDSAAPVVISMINGGGGNAGSIFNANFVEIFNRSCAAVNLEGWSLQYTSAGGANTFDGARQVNLTGSIQPGQYLLIQTERVGGAAPGLPIPTADFLAFPSDPEASPVPPQTQNGFGLGNDAGRLALCSTVAPIGGDCGHPGIVDLVGYGLSAFCYEGVAPTANASNTFAVIRKNSGCQDSNQGFNDFDVVFPRDPNNSASLIHACTDCAPPACPADFNEDGFVNPDDLADFITCFFLDIQFPGFCPAADFNGDTSRDPDDLADFITTFFLAVQFGC